ncbi:hypothetical protein GCM10025869_14380 [Homoserinibacter gongjuensis]|uniref:Uncharacterized protein n=1 Tax=Homoserinibacter gongjuensis TaxID=1162968 RepID=A0ABQ6JUF6_9MICO|nr:hypothetical protein GCM10025869_14380 [Homoserinibacter gongjuensis]
MTGRHDVQHDAALAVATDAASAFPGSRVGLQPYAPGVGEVWVTTPDPAERLLDRLAEDPVIVGLVDAAAAASTNLAFVAPGLELWGVPAAEVRSAYSGCGGVKNTCHVDRPATATRSAQHEQEPELARPGFTARAARAREALPGSGRCGSSTLPSQRTSTPWRG